MSSMARELWPDRWFGDRARQRLAVLREVDPWLVLCTVALLLCGLVFIGSATQDDAQFGNQQGRQALFVVCGAGISFFLLLVPYARLMRGAWLLYFATVVALLGLPFFAPVINGARRWYSLPGFSIQPSEFAKLAVVLALAALLRFKSRARTVEGLFVPMLVAAVPALLILRQPDLGSALVFAPVLLAMCFVAGAPPRSVLLVVLVALGVGVIAYFTSLHGYQKERIDVWLKHWTWTDELIKADEGVRDLILNKGYQSWQALIAMGGGGLTGFGIGSGPQNRYDFLPYRSEDYVFAVVGEETGWLGCVLVLGLMFALVIGILGIAARTRERFGRLVCVGVATWLGMQSLVHVAVCAWLVPATGLPMPALSYGGSSTMATLLGIVVCLNIGARREPVLAGDGFR
ncbi:MAG: FtsW/RodA/SpoVE family cell cycle protein [Planctomycetes bacterium]|nr:FtsW/RodA/SpoVE family cell cycle protein [Planctomycetota bacterium]